MTIKNVTPRISDLSDYDIYELLKDGRNVELALRFICLKEGWVLSKDPDQPSRNVVFIGKDKYVVRCKCSKGFDLAPAYMKGSQRKRTKQEALEFARNNNFLLVNTNNGRRIDYKAIKNPNVTHIANI